MARRNGPDRENNVEVVKLSSQQLETLCGSTREVVVHVKRYSLSTKYQPVSIVITGDFDFDGVKVEDNTSLNMPDVPGTEPADLTDLFVFILIIIGALVVLVGW